MMIFHFYFLSKANGKIFCSRLKDTSFFAFSMFKKKKQENNRVGDISPSFQRHCQTNRFASVFGIKTKYHRLRCFLVFS